MPHLDDHLTYRTEPSSDGVRYVLPRRPHGRGGGICLILFGLLFSGFAVFWILGASGLADPLLEAITGDAPPPINRNGPTETEDPDTGPAEADPFADPPRPSPQRSPAPTGFDIGRLFFALFGLPFFLAGMVPITAGVMAIFGHSEVEVTSDEIIAIARAGFIRRRKRRPLPSLERFDVGRDPSRVAADAADLRRKPRPMVEVFAIHAQFTGDPPLAIATGYPMAMLKPLAADLAREHERRTIGKTVEVRDTSRDALDDEAAGEGSRREPYTPEQVPPQPESSAAVLERVSSGLTLRVPPTGFKKAAMVPVIFGLAWCGFVSIFTFAMIAIGVPWPLFLFISLFWIIGIAVLLIGVNMARKQAVIDVVHDTLLVTQQSLFGRRQHEWTVDQLLDIRVDHSGVTVNNKAIENLQIVPREGSIVGLFTGRDEGELHWMAAELRTAMGMRKHD